MKKSLLLLCFFLSTLAACTKKGAEPKPANESSIIGLWKIASFQNEYYYKGNLIGADNNSKVYDLAYIEFNIDGTGQSGIDTYVSMSFNYKHQNQLIYFTSVHNSNGVETKDYSNKVEKLTPQELIISNEIIDPTATFQWNGSRYDRFKSTLRYTK